MIGAADGAAVGGRVGPAVGAADGPPDVAMISAADGDAVGGRVGPAVGAADGPVGVNVGAGDGPVGAKVGTGDGAIVGIQLGVDVDAVLTDIFEAADPYRTASHIAIATVMATDAPMSNLYSQRNFGFAPCESNSITPTIFINFLSDCGLLNADC